MIEPRSGNSRSFWMLRKYKSMRTATSPPCHQTATTAAMTITSPHHSSRSCAKVRQLMHDPSACQDMSGVASGLAKTTTTRRTGQSTRKAHLLKPLSTKARDLEPMRSNQRNFVNRYAHCRLTRDEVRERSVEGNLHSRRRRRYVRVRFQVLRQLPHSDSPRVRRADKVVPARRKCRRRDRNRGLLSLLLQPPGVLAPTRYSVWGADEMW